MRQLTEKEREIIILLTKDFTSAYNARSLTKQIKMSPRGALKALKLLEQNNIVKGTRIGKAIVYKMNFDPYTKKLVALFLFEESQSKAVRWIEEFKDIKAKALILFGSILHSKHQNDIDLLIISNKKNIPVLEHIIHKKNELMLKPIHPVWQTKEDFKKNMLKKDPVLLEIIKTGIILLGQDEIIEVLADVSR